MSQLLRIITFTCALFLQSTSYAQDHERQLKIIENHTLESPISNRELGHWTTGGSAIMLKNNIVVVPEISDKKGSIYNVNVNEDKDQWIIEARVKIGNT